MNKVTYYGSEKEISEAIDTLKSYEKSKPKGPHLESMTEGNARLIVQQLIDQHHLKASILINGNTVWSKDRILRNLEQIMKHGTLYNQEDQSKPPILSHYFYQFLHLQCGGIAHTDVFGWVSKYPTLEALKKFFQRNEFGKPVRDWIPQDHADAKAIIEAIEAKLFPFQTYMKAKEETKK